MQKVKPLSRKNIREIVDLVKKYLNISATDCVDVLRLLEYVLPARLKNFDYEICDKEEMGDEHGRTFPDESLIKIREDVYEGAVNGVGRDRMTIMHEIGHLFLHEQSVVSFARNGSLKPFEDPEWQADCFAGEFLMPASMIKDMAIDEIKSKYKVSSTAAETQKKKLK